MTNSIPLSVNAVQKSLSNFSYLSNNSNHVINIQYEKERLTDSREAHNKYHLQNRIPNSNQEFGWFLIPQVPYKITANVSINIPTGMKGIIFGNALVLDNGIQVLPTILDSGNYTEVSFNVYNTYGVTFLETDTIIANVIMIEEDDADISQWLTHKEQIKPTVEESKFESSEPLPEIIEETVSEIKTADPIDVASEETIEEPKVEDVKPVENLDRQEPRKRRP